MDKKSSSIRTAYRIILAAVVIILATVLVMFLRKPYGGAYDLDKMLPKLGQAPVYVELKDGVTFKTMYTAKKDMSVKGVELLMVHTDEEIDPDVLNPSVHLEVIDMLSSDSAPVWTEDIYLSQIRQGEWSHIPVAFDMLDKHMYSYEFTPVGCNPYFMKVEAYEPGISLGFEVLSDRVVTYGDVFYYSIPLIILASLLAVLIILFGTDRVFATVRKVWPHSHKIFNIAFLIILFITLSLKIYKTAYIDGIYISADSDGYLREAVNLIAGNAFSYEGLAGYKSHFANWPIIYPAMIASMMLITGANAYLASKYLTIVLLALILIVLYVAFKDKAWIYSLAFTNLGFLGIAYHTWSELPFIIFLMLFAFAMAKIVSLDTVKVSTYICLGSSALAAFLTRYFGMYLWFVAGMYWVLLLILYLRSKSDNGVRPEAGKSESPDKTKSPSHFYFRKLISIAISMGVSGALAFGYLIMNKIRNGNPTGVARGTWWDDYMSLTNDLIRSLVTEVFNVFSLDVPEVIDKMEPRLQVWVILLVNVLVIALIANCLRKIGAGTDRTALSEGVSGRDKTGIKGIVDALMNPSMVFVTMAVVYYAMFIVIRYRSSMDTFYFRFFAPATILLVMGLIGLMLGGMDGFKSGKSSTDKDADDACESNAGGQCFKTPLSVLAVAVTVILLADLTDTAGNMYRMRYEVPYYDIITGTWDEAYSEIPDHSVILWNPMDFRSSWYRPDVYSGDLGMEDTWDDLCERYYGSDHICMLRVDAEVVVNDGSYDASITDRLKEALDMVEPYNSYVVIDK